MARHAAPDRETELARKRLEKRVKQGTVQGLALHLQEKHEREGIPDGRDWEYGSVSLIAVDELPEPPGSWIAEADHTLLVWEALTGKCYKPSETGDSWVPA